MGRKIWKRVALGLMGIPVGMLFRWIWTYLHYGPDSPWYDAEKEAARILRRFKYAEGI